MIDLDKNKNNDLLQVGWKGCEVGGDLMFMTSIVRLRVRPSV